MERDAAACAGRRCRAFRQRYHHLSAVGCGCGVHASQLAWVTQRADSSVAEAVPSFGLSRLFDSVAERTRLAVEADCILAIAGVERSGPGCGPAACLGLCGCDCI